MRTVVVGAGPIGSFSALALARRGHDVTLVDRDPGPAGHAPWSRRGVMQFDLPHFFRHLVRQALCAEVPELWDALLLAGGEPARPAGAPEHATGLACRRSTFERTVWTFTDTEPGVTRVTGHADRLLRAGERVTGVVVDGVALPADLVLVATGRAGHLGDELRAPGEGGPCGFSYAARQYRARPGVELPGWGRPERVVYDGYEAIVFPQDARTLSALLVRQTRDAGLASVRHAAVFSAATAVVPLLAEWTDPASFEPISGVRAGSNLVNAYRGQRGRDGGFAPGLLVIGDAVCTTNPAAGRGVSLGLLQAQALLAMLDTDDDLRGVAARFDAWCDEHIRPWYADHVRSDAAQLRRFAGDDVDLAAPIPSEMVVACAEVDRSIMAAAGPYLAMVAGPGVLDGVQDKARAVLRTGWRPSYAVGPSRDELVERVLAAAA